MNFYQILIENHRRRSKKNPIDPDASGRTKRDEDGQLRFFQRDEGAGTREAFKAASHAEAWGSVEKRELNRF